LYPRKINMNPHINKQNPTYHPEERKQITETTDILNAKLYKLQQKVFVFFFLVRIILHQVV